MTRILDFVAERWLVLTLLCLIAITLLSLWPVESLPSVPGTDKTHHFIAYGSLTLPVALRRPQYWLLIILSFAIWSGLIELIQPFVNRYGEWLDLLANIGGIACGVVLAALFNKLRAP